MCVDELMTILGDYPGDATVRLSGDGFLEVIAESGELFGTIDLGV